MRNGYFSDSIFGYQFKKSPSLRYFLCKLYSIELMINASVISYSNSQKTTWFVQLVLIQRKINDRFFSTYCFLLRVLLNV